MEILVTTLKLQKGCFAETSNLLPKNDQLRTCRIEIKDEEIPDENFEKTSRIIKGVDIKARFLNLGLTECPLNFFFDLFKIIKQNFESH